MILRDIIPVVIPKIKSITPITASSINAVLTSNQSEIMHIVIEASVKIYPRISIKNVFLETIRLSFEYEIIKNTFCFNFVF